MANTSRRNNLRAEMARRNITIVELAFRIGLGKKHVSNVLLGRSPMTERVARDIIRELDLPAELVVADEAVPA